MQCTAVQTRSLAPYFVLLRDSHPRRPASRRNKPELLVQHSDATLNHFSRVWKIVGPSIRSEALES